MKTNICKLRLSKNAFEVPQEPQMGEECIFQGKGEIVKKTEVSNQDGTVNRVYDLKPQIIEIKSTEHKDKVITKDFIKDKSRSQALRDKIYKLWIEKGSKGSFKGFYNDQYDYFDSWILNQVDQEMMGY